jgi:hypothetical protein
MSVALLVYAHFLTSLLPGILQLNFTLSSLPDFPQILLVYHKKRAAAKNSCCTATIAAIKMTQSMAQEFLLTSNKLESEMQQ